jgi:hypothetical protein
VRLSLGLKKSSLVGAYSTRSPLREEAGVVGDAAGHAACCGVTMMKV